jgi:hypothetical protein
MKKKYRDLNLGRAKLEILAKANDIIQEYQELPLLLTLRQLYYQFVSRDWLPNTINSYKNLGNAVADGRIAGLVDWAAIEDRTRETISPNHWDNPSAILYSAAYSFKLDKWKGQPWAPEVWIEKEALAGVVAAACEDLDVPFCACRGYGSHPMLHEASRRFKDYLDDGREPIIFYLGDHDPSGLAIPRFIEEYMSLFCGQSIQVSSIALTMDQVQDLKPPPNPAKKTDPRFKAYKEAWGDESWELDALPPAYLRDLVKEHVEDACEDTYLYQERVEEELAGTRKLRRLAKQWDSIAEPDEEEEESDG